jgi:hypothetical protein
MPPVVLEMTDEETTTPANSGTPPGDDSAATGKAKDEGKAEIGQEAEAGKPAGDDSAETGDDSAEKGEAGKTGEEPPKASEEKPEEVPGKGKEKEVDKTQEELRRYQSDRDRAEQQLKEFYKQVMPFVEVDDYGRIMGPKKPAEPENADQKYDVEALSEAAASGDKEAFKTLLWISKEQGKREAKDELRGEFRNSVSVETERQGLKNDFPDLYVKDEKGNPTDKADNTSPLFTETLKVFGERPYLNIKNPRDVRTAAVEAENRILKAGLPDLEKKIRNEVQTRFKKAGAGAVAVSAGGGQAADELKGVLTEDQDGALKREGYDEDGRKRIARIVKQAKKEGGFYL